MLLNATSNKPVPVKLFTSSVMSDVEDVENDEDGYKLHFTGQVLIFTTNCDTFEIFFSFLDVRC